MEKLIEILTSNTYFKHKYTKSISWKKQEILLDVKSHFNSGIICLVRKGELKIEIQKNGQWIPLTILKNNDFIGIEYLVPFHEEIFKLNYRIIALSDGEGIQIQHEYFMNHVYADPRFLNVLLQRVSMRYLFLLQRHALTDESLDKKLARVLWEFSSFETLENPALMKMNVYKVPSYITQQILAEYLQVSVYKIRQIFVQWLEDTGILSSIRPIVINKDKLKQVYYL
ncbi:Crp/Fnr family transcriptional regulator [Listeria costaricensis]|uniref:Crp/Fnr family transcriptional regulator n=1 Tax=Listeria costaricensis TaxID=2026604 RepID=UPI000C0867F1|nr:Crp/Fnr family transcriptional regulator [Listeria costaricensis]